MAAKEQWQQESVRREGLIRGRTQGVTVKISVCGDGNGGKPGQQMILWGGLMGINKRVQGEVVRCPLLRKLGGKRGRRAVRNIKIQKNKQRSLDIE